MMQELEPTWGRVIAIWWLLTWRTWIGAIVLGAIFGGIIGGVLAAAGYSVEENEIYFTLGGAVIGATWSLAVMRMALEKGYRGFRIVLLPKDSD